MTAFGWNITLAVWPCTSIEARCSRLMLRALKARGYRIVQVVPAGGHPAAD